jgi:hypothetical protein
MNQFAFAPTLLLHVADADAATFSNQQFFRFSHADVLLHAQITSAQRMAVSEGRSSEVTP